MSNNNGRILAGLEALALAVAVGFGVWGVAGSCGGVARDMCAFAPLSKVSVGVLDTGVMLFAGALLAVTLSRVDRALGVKCARVKKHRKATGD